MNTSSDKTGLIREGNSFFAGYYSGDLKTEVLDFKRGNKRSIASWTSYIGHRLSILPKVDAIVRALGHSEIMAEHNTSLDVFASSISRFIDAQYHPALLKKHHTNEKSTDLNRAQRLAQINSLYFVDGDYSASKLTGLKTFLIIDDVVTTGATTREITRALASHFPEAVVYVLSLVKTSRGELDNKQKQQNLSTNLEFISIKDSLQLEQPNYKRNFRAQDRIELQQKNYTANYCHTNHNFVIQNLPWKGIRKQSTDGIHTAIAILKNILQRGSPTEASRYLRQELSIDSSLTLNPVPLISSPPLMWRHTIKGDNKRSYNPAKTLYEKLLPKYLGTYGFSCNLIVPEPMLNEITNQFVPQFHNRQVDFFLPQAAVIIEVDGKQHKNSQTEDQARDDHALNYGLHTVRITTDEINQENDSFLEKISLLIQYIQSAIDKTKKRKDNGECVFSIEDYKNEIDNPTPINSPSLVLTAVIRFQLLVLELLDSGYLKIGELWSFSIKNRDNIEFVDIALADIEIWLKTLFSLQKIDFPGIQSCIQRINDTEAYPNNTKSINVDFSITQRFTDVFQQTPDVIFVRTHYLDEYRDFEQSSSSNLSSMIFRPYDYFEAETLEPVNYELNLAKGSRHYRDLRLVLSNVFLPYSDHVDFRDGQIGIIGSALSLNSTIGLLPTGSGKSVCFQLSAILQPAISFVVCPIKSLMIDQEVDLASVGFTRAAFINGDLTASEKERNLIEFGQGRFFLLFISPERLQITKFRNYLRSIAYDRSIAYAVIDEVHCLSEWGHDFRPSYLNLANTVNRFCPGSTYIGLTATASVNVLKDIQSEFNIPNHYVKTPISFTRQELMFNVIDDKGDKNKALREQVSVLESKWEALQGQGRPGAGIIFTPSVNGPRGCAPISKELQRELNIDVRFYSGSPPKLSKTRPMSENEFINYKNEVQADFKKNNFHLLAATKAFGMGVNKGNVAYTVHYGIPGSLEALYQEAGRAGRSKLLFSETPADCVVLLGKEQTALLKSVWDPKTAVEELKDIEKSLSRSGDIKSMLWMMTNNLDSTLSEFDSLNAVYKAISATGENKIKINSRMFPKQNNSMLQRTIYRLSQLGIVSDWTVEDFFTGALEVHLTHASPALIHETLQKTITKYDSNISINSLQDASDSSYATYFEMEKRNKITKIELCFLILLQWSYDHFIYNRRQSLKNVYEQCVKLSSNQITRQAFKVSIENYFKFDNTSAELTHIVENQNEWSKWFEVFDYVSTPESIDVKLSNNSLRALESQLGRFLESYRDNPGLNFISGMVRLCLNDFENADGRPRFELAMAQIKQFEVKQQCQFAKLLCGFNNTLTEQQKQILTRIVCRYIRSIGPLKILQAGFKDQNSLYSLLQYYSYDISHATNALKEKLWLK